MSEAFKVVTLKHTTKARSSELVVIDYFSKANDITNELILLYFHHLRYVFSHDRKIARGEKKWKLEK